MELKKTNKEEKKKERNKEEQGRHLWQREYKGLVRDKSWQCLEDNGLIEVSVKCYSLKEKERENVRV